MSIYSQSVTGELPHVIFSLRRGKYALSSEHVEHIENMKPISPVVGMNQFYRGVINYLGSSVPVCDLRMLFNMAAAAEDSSRFFRGWHEEIEAWLNSVEQAVETGLHNMPSRSNGREKLQRQIANFNENLGYLDVSVSDIAKNAEAIFDSRDDIERLIKDGRKADALETIVQIRENELQAIETALRTADKEYAENPREMLIVLKAHKRRICVVVDDIVGIRVLDDLTPVPPNLPNGRCRFIEQFAREHLPDGSIDFIQILSASEIMTDESVKQILDSVEAG